MPWASWVSATLDGGSPVVLVDLFVWLEGGSCGYVVSQDFSRYSCSDDVMAMMMVMIMVRHGHMMLAMFMAIVVSVDAWEENVIMRKGFTSVFDIIVPLIRSNLSSSVEAIEGC